MKNLFRTLGALALISSSAAALAQTPRLGDERHGPIAAPRVSLDALATPTIDSSLRASPPPGGAFRISGTGNEYSVCGQLGCDVKRDILLTQFYLRGQSKWDVTHAESQVVLDNYINTGYVPTWAKSTAYTAGTIISNSDTLYKATKSGTSASSGTGPSGTASSVSDGSVIWSYISSQDDTDNKTTLSVTTGFGPNAGRSWGWATNTHIYPGFKAQTAFASEEDFTNLGQACDLIPANCFLKNMFVGGGTITAVLKISPGGGISPISGDRSSGGAAKYGLAVDGANTIRDILVSDGANSTISYKGWAGTAHPGGFIVDQSTSPSTVVAAGVNSTAAYDDQSAAPYGMWARGTYGIAAYRHGGFEIGSWGGDGTGTYKAWTMNGDLGASTMLGCFGKAGDNGLYCNVPAAGHYEQRAGGATLATLDPTQLKSYVQVQAPQVNLTPTTPASSAAACNAGTINVDASYIYVCTATNTWKRAALSAF